MKPLWIWHLMISIAFQICIRMQLNACPYLRFNLDAAFIYVSTQVLLTARNNNNNNNKNILNKSRLLLFFLTQRALQLVLTPGQTPGPVPGLVPADDPGATRFRKRRSLAALWCRLNCCACAVLNKRDLGLLHNCLFFILPGLPATPVHRRCGNTHYSFLFFFSPSVKQRLGNEWGPFPQRGSGNVKTDFPLTPLEVTGYIISLCF